MISRHLLVTSSQRTSLIGSSQDLCQLNAFSEYCIPQNFVDTSLKAGYYLLLTVDCAGTRGVPRRGQDGDQPEAGGGVRHRAAEAVQARHQAAAPAAGLCTC